MKHAMATPPLTGAVCNVPRPFLVQLERVVTQKGQGARSFFRAKLFLSKTEVPVFLRQFKAGTLTKLQEEISEWIRKPN